MDHDKLIEKKLKITRNQSFLKNQIKQYDKIFNHIHS